jgi:hypothetical protein
MALKERIDHRARQEDLSNECLFTPLYSGREKSARAWRVEGTFFAVDCLPKSVPFGALEEGGKLEAGRRHQGRGHQGN